MKKFVVNSARKGWGREDLYLDTINYDFFFLMRKIINSVFSLFVFRDQKSIGSNLSKVSADLREGNEG